MKFTDSRIEKDNKGYYIYRKNKLWGKNGLIKFYGFINKCITCDELYFACKKNSIYCSNKCHLKKGGKYKSTAGYIYISNPNHPYAQKNGYVAEHRLVMEEYLKRYLKPKEHIHHKNNIYNDNRIENLLLTTNSEHAKITNSYFKKGHLVSEETRKKISKTWFKKGQPSLWKGRKHKLESKIKMKISRLAYLKRRQLCHIQQVQISLWE